MPDEIPTVCPYLGLPGDPQSHFSFPEGGHRCSAMDGEARIDLAFQAGTCLSSEYTSCARFRSATHPPMSPVAGVTVTTAAAGPVRTSRRRTFVRGLIGVALLAGVGVASITLAILIAGINRESAGTSPTVPPFAAASPTSEPSASATPLPTPTASATPSASPVVTATPAPSATASPTPQPTPTLEPTPIVYVVEQGDTLRRIAAFYGVTVAAVVEANDLADPDDIRVGQGLIIPVK